MKFLLSIALIFCFACSGAETGTATTNPEPEASVNTEDHASLAANGPFDGRSLCEILDEARIQELIGCAATLQSTPRERDNSSSCTYTCTDANTFSMTQLTVTWSEDGTDVSPALKTRRDKNAALESLDIPGYDFAHLQPEQNRIMAISGPYSITLIAGGKDRNTAIELAMILIESVE